MAYSVGGYAPQLVTTVAAPVTALLTTVIADRSLTVAGALPEYSYHVTWPAIDTGLLLITAWCDVAGTLKIRLYNPTGSTITPAAATLKILAF